MGLERDFSLCFGLEAIREAGECGPLGGFVSPPFTSQLGLCVMGGEEEVLYFRR